MVTKTKQVSDVYVKGDSVQYNTLDGHTEILCKLEELPELDIYEHMLPKEAEEQLVELRKAVESARVKVDDQYFWRVEEKNGNLVIPLDTELTDDIKVHSGYIRQPESELLVPELNSRTILRKESKTTVETIKESYNGNWFTAISSLSILTSAMILGQLMVSSVSAFIILFPYLLLFSPFIMLSMIHIASIIYAIYAGLTKSGTDIEVAYTENLFYKILRNI